MTALDWLYAVGFVAMGFFHLGLYGACVWKVWRTTR